LKLLKKIIGSGGFGGLEDYRYNSNIFFYLFIILFLLFLSSNPPTKRKKIIKINTYTFGGLIFLLPQSSISSRKELINGYA